MKILATIAAVLVLMVFSSCQKDDAHDPIAGLKLADTRLGGCNSGLKSLLVDENPSSDSLFYTVSGDSIKFFVGINYVCCAPFESECKIVNDTISMYIKDVCNLSKDPCYCNCMCYYTFDFIFTGRDKDKYPYKVFLYNPSIGSDKEIFSGVIAIK